jgi:hypothetical protein
MDAYNGDERGIEIAREAADFVSQRLHVAAVYGETERQLRRGSVVSHSRGCQTLRVAPHPSPPCRTCGSSAPSGLLDLDISADVFSSDPPSILVMHFAVALEAIAAELSAAQGPVLTFDLPVPHSVECAGRAVAGNVALRFVRLYEAHTDRFRHRFDVLFCPASLDLVEAFAHPQQPQS